MNPHAYFSLYCQDKSISSLRISKRGDHTPLPHRFKRWYRVFTFWLQRSVWWKRNASANMDRMFVTGQDVYQFFWVCWLYFLPYHLGAFMLVMWFHFHEGCLTSEHQIKRVLWENKSKKTQHQAISVARRIVASKCRNNGLFVCVPGSQSVNIPNKQCCHQYSPVVRRRIRQQARGNLPRTFRDLQNHFCHPQN